MRIDKELHAYIKAENSSMGDRVAVALEVFKLLVEQSQEGKISMTAHIRLTDLWILIEDAVQQHNTTDNEEAS